MDLSVFLCRAALLERYPAVTVLPHLRFSPSFHFISLAGLGAALPCRGAAEGQPWDGVRGEGARAGTCWLLELVGRWCLVLGVMESGRRLESATVNTSNRTENKRCRIVSLITRIYHRLLAELAKLALCLIPSIWSKLLAVRFLNPARRRNFGSVSGQTPRGPRGGRGI